MSDSRKNWFFSKFLLNKHPPMIFLYFLYLTNQLNLMRNHYACYNKSQWIATPPYALALISVAPSPILLSTIPSQNKSRLSNCFLRLPIPHWLFWKVWNAFSPVDLTNKQLSYMAQPLPRMPCWSIKVPKLR